METLKAVIENGVVTNILVVDPANHEAVAGVLVPQGVPVGIGWACVGTDFTAPASNEPPNAAIDAQIAALEATTTQRRLRDAVLGSGAVWLTSIDAQIAALRAQRV